MLKHGLTDVVSWSKFVKGSKFLVVFTLQLQITFEIYKQVILVYVGGR